MKKILAILLILICQQAICQTNTYTAFWKVNPKSNVTLFTIQISTDQVNWATVKTIVPVTDSLSYKADFTALENDYIRVEATTKDIVWPSQTIQVVQVLPIRLSNVNFKTIKYK